MASIENEKDYLIKAEASGFASRLLAYTKLSGPGWLQSAITLGGGSLASSLFLGSFSRIQPSMVTTHGDYPRSNHAFCD